jgi:hypothetical protein
MNGFEIFKLLLILFFISIIVLIIHLLKKSKLNENNKNPSGIPKVNPDMDSNQISNIQNQWKNINEPVYNADDTNFLNSLRVKNLNEQLENAKLNAPYRLFDLKTVPGYMTDDHKVVWYLLDGPKFESTQIPTLKIQLKNLMGYYKQLIDLLNVLYPNNLSEGMYYTLLSYTKDYTNALLQLRYFN